MVLPNEWKEVKLRDVCSLLSGQDFSPELYSDKTLGIPYITGASNFVSNHIVLNRWTNCPRCIAHRGEILLVCKGSGFGTLAIADFEKAHIARQIMALQNLKGIDRDFLFNVIATNFANIKQKGCGLIPGIDRKTVLNISFTLPPLAEQKKIAETLSVWDSAIEKMEKLIDEKENLFKVELKAKIIVRGFEENWEKFTVKDCVVALTPPSRISQDNYKKTGNFPVIDQSKEPIAGWTNDENCIIRSSNPLIIFGDHTCILKIMKIPFAQGADGIKVLSANDRFDAPFLYYSLKADPVVPEGYKRHYSSLQRKEVFCPSKDIQKKLARYFEIKEKELSLLKQQLALYKKQKQGLMQKLLTGEWRV